MPKYVAGIDAGTTGATVMIADLKGNIVEQRTGSIHASFLILDGWNRT